MLTILPILRKVLWFALWGAAGALIASMMGELWMWSTAGTPRHPTIALVLDCSGSMHGEKLAEMKSAAVDFVNSGILANSTIGVTEFETGAKVLSPPTADHDALVKSLHRLKSTGGGTNLAAGLLAAAGSLPEKGIDRYLVLFTDGIADSEILGLQAAKSCHDSGVSIIAVGTGDADTRYLQDLTGDPGLVFTATPGEFAKAFQQVQSTLQTLVGSSSGRIGGLWSPLRIGVWTGLLATGIGLCLIVAQNRYVGKRPFEGSLVWLAVIACPVTGFLAGFLSELLFLTAAPSAGWILVAIRLIGWVVMGGLLGAGLSRIIPNLDTRRGMTGGAIGGAIGVLGFDVISLVLTEILGRWSGAAMIGFCIGAMLIWIDVLFREASLEIDYGHGERRTLSLGPEPIIIGSVSGRCTVYIPDSLMQRLSFQLRDGYVLCEDLEQKRSIPFVPGDVFHIGRATITVRSPQQQQDSVTTSPKSSGFKPRILDTIALVAGNKNNPSQKPSETNEAKPHLIIQWHRYPLTDGVRFVGSQIPGLEPGSSDGCVAAVQPHPQERSTLGLKNLSRISWQATINGGRRLTIEPGRSVRIAQSTVILFGTTEGTIEFE